MALCYAWMSSCEPYTVRFSELGQSLALVAAELFDFGQKLDPAGLGSIAPGFPRAERRREFNLGRACARLALAKLGAPGVVPVNPDRTPCWPVGVTGSISHTRGYAAVVVGFKTSMAGVGLDVEEIGVLDAEIWDTIYTDDELRLLNHCPRMHAGWLATAIFCAKEATFKAVYPFLGGGFEPRLFNVSVRGAGVAQTELSHNSVNIPVRYARVESRLTAIAIVNASSFASALKTGN